MRAHAWGRWLSVPLLAFASCARPAPPLDPPPPDDSLPAEACAPIDLEDPARFSACSKGSGSFGRWGLDEAGLPIYEYMIDQAADDSAVWFTTETLSDPSLEPRTHWAAFGNHRINATFSNDGVIEVVTQDRGVEYLNKLDDDRAWFGGGFSYIDDGEETFSTSYRDRPEHADTRRVFGMGYAEAATAYRDIVVVHRTYAPWGDAPYLIDEVSVENVGETAKTLSHYEVFDVARRPIDINWAVSGAVGSIPAGVRATRDATNANFDETVSYEPTMQRLAVRRSHAAGFEALAEDEPAARNDYPPDPFLQALLGEVSDTFSDKAAFFGDAGRAQPAAVAERAPGDGTAGGSRGPTSGDGQPHMLALKSELTLAAGERQRLRFAYGYAPMGEAFQVDPKFSDTSVDGLSEYRAALRERAFSFACEDEPALTRELAWHAYSMQASVGQRDYFEGPVVPQGSAYLYLHGADGAARDLGLFALPLTYFDPELARAELELYMRVQFAEDGRFSYSFQGHGMLDDAGVHHAPSDLDLFFLWALGEYVGATGDTAFLDATVPFWPKEAWPDATVMDHVTASVRHLFDVVSTGEHGLVRVGTGDWSDGIVFEAPLDKHDFVAENGESVPNTQMAIAVLPRAAAMIEGHDPALAAEIRGRVQAYRSALPTAWGGDFFGRAYFGDGVLVRGGEIDLEAQVWSLIGDSFASSNDRDTTLEAILATLDTPSPAGATLREGGQVWPAISALLTEGYAVTQPELAWSHFKRNTLLGHAEAYPDTWFGIWDAPDGMNGPTGDRPGGTWFSVVTPMTDYPVQNNNAHAMPLYAALRMAGLRATGRGLVVAPKIPDHDFALKTTLVDVQRSETALRVRYTPRGPAARLVEISPPPGTIITAAFLDGGPRAIDSEELATFFVVGGDGTSFDFEVTLSPIGSD